MVQINLRDFYPFYNSDTFVEVPDEVAAALTEAERLERNYIRRVVYNKAFYSLDTGDGIEHDALFRAPSPGKAYERKIVMENLYTALNALPNKQRQRLYAHYILGISQTEIAKSDCVSAVAVNISLARGLKKLERLLEKIF